MSNATRMNAGVRTTNYRAAELHRTRRNEQLDPAAFRAELSGVKGRPLTPKQERRIRQKNIRPSLTPDPIAVPPTLPVVSLPEEENRAILEALETPIEEFVEVGPPVEELSELLDGNPWDVPAETFGDFGPVTVPARPCGGTDYCVTASGKKASKTHVKCAA